ncbi:MAG: hypothetical protein NT150_05620 [Bacteroidetes bacterium]|nr:hypothetical protein [Bacteroidota bacterium]
MVKLTFFALLSSVVLFSCTEEPKEVVQNVVVEPTIVGDSSLSLDIVAYKTVLNVVRESELMPDFTFVPGDVEKAKAYIANNERLLEYNPDFIEKLQEQSLNDTNWTGISILAREISHHLAKHKLSGGSPSANENLEADKNAGFVLYKMGASLEESITALEESSNEQSPAQALIFSKRKKALTEGWEEAKTLHAPPKKADQLAVTKEISKAESKQKKAVADVNGGRKVMFNVFIASDSLIYKVDANNEIFVTINNKVSVVGKKLPSNKLGFDWFFEQNHNRYGVDKAGRIWARSLEGEFKVIGQAIAQKN